MSGQNKPNLYEKRFVFVSSQAISATFNSNVQDLRKYQAGIVKTKWTSYDGATGKIYLQISDVNTTDDTDWCIWGGEAGQRTLDAATGTVIWELDEIPPVFMRLHIELGDGTGITITSAAHILGY